MARKIVHWELMGPDGDKLTKFYADLFGWNPQPYPGFDGYNGVTAEEAGVGGAVGRGSDEMPNYMTFYIEVDSIDDHLARIMDAGGQVMMPKTVVPGTVTFALFSDIAGNMVGLVEADMPPAE